MKRNFGSGKFVEYITKSKIKDGDFGCLYKKVVLHVPLCLVEIKFGNNSTALAAAISE